MLIDAPSQGAVAGNREVSARDPAVQPSTFCSCLPRTAVDAADFRVVGRYIGPTLRLEKENCGKASGRVRRAKNAVTSGPLLWPCLPRGREPGHVVRELPEERVLPQKLVRSHRLGEGEPAVVGPNVHDVRVYLFSCGFW